MIHDNATFLQVISDSFREFIASGTSRSTATLKPLHGAIAHDLSELLGEDYEVWSQGFERDKEAEIAGRYINKKVDITVKSEGHPVAGIAVKFVMQNYSQNSNNYFENMLGETANIRCNDFPYFQVFIILDKLPYYDRQKNIKKWETFTEHNVSKYVTLSRDDTSVYLHAPNKTLIYVVHVPDNDSLTTLEEYRAYYSAQSFRLTLSPLPYAPFGRSVILNDYAQFIDKVYHAIRSV